MQQQWHWGIDLGGTKIEGVVFSTSPELKVLVRERIPTERQKGYHHILHQIQKMIGLLVSKTGQNPVQIGIGTPGTYDLTSKSIKNSNTTVLNGEDLVGDLTSHTGIPFITANDANCFALAETVLGAGKHAKVTDKTVFGIILGTGVGGGIVVWGNALAGLHGIAGEWGHNFLDESGGKCYCGKTGCVETIISGPALEKYYASISGKNLPLKKIANEALKDTDPAAQETIDRLCRFFGKAIAVPLNIMDPDAVIIGGGVGNIDALYTFGNQHALSHVFNNQLQTEFLKPVLGDSAGVFGAGLLTFQGL